MLGNIILGSGIYGDKLLGIYTVEVSANINNSKIGVLYRCHGVFSSFHTTLRIPDLDTYIDLANIDYIPRMGLGVYGNFDEFGTTLLTRLALGAYSKFINPEIVARGYVRLLLDIGAIFHLSHPYSNWIAWSNIGELNFNIDSSNVAGKMPIGFKGFIYAIEQLGDSKLIFVYGDSGIAVITPQDLFYKKGLVSKVGIKGNGAVVNTGESHYFINTVGELYRVSGDGKIVKLGYREFLSQMPLPYMSYDDVNSLVYICDGTLGYVYSEDSESLGTGPVNITGVKWQDDNMWVGASNTIAHPAFSIVTDIYDMGTRKGKTISGLALTVSDPTGLNAAIDFRLSSKDPFTSTPTLGVGPDGNVKLPCYGVEFRFRIGGTTVAEDLKIESIIVKGRIHDYMYLDTDHIN